MTARVSEDPAGLVAVLMVLQASMAAVGMVATVAALDPAVRTAQLELLCMPSRPEPVAERCGCGWPTCPGCRRRDDDGGDHG